MQAALAIYLKHLYRFVRSPMEVSATLFLPVLLVALFGVGMASAVGGVAAGAGAGAAAGPAAGAGAGVGVGAAVAAQGLFVGGYLTYMAPGAAVLAVLSSAVMGGATLLQERLSGVLRQYLVAPVPRSAILVGTVGSAVTKALGQAVLVLLLAGLVGARWQPRAGPALAALVGLAAFALGFAGLAAFFASRASSMAAFHGIITLFNVPLLFASNALYPLQGQPLWLRLAATFNPTSYAVELLRLALGTGPGELLGVGGNLAVLLLFAAFGVACGVRGARRWATPL